MSLNVATYLNFSKRISLYPWFSMDIGEVNSLNVNVI